MPGFKCQNCEHDLSRRIDIIASTLRNDPDPDYVLEGMSLEGNCEECYAPFIFEGPMFNYYLATKVEEGVISYDNQEFGFLELSLTEEELEYFRQLVEEEKFEELNLFMLALLLRHDDDPDWD